MKAIVLSSGGVDSSTCVSIAVDKYGAENVSTVTIFYGQTLKKEILSARKLAEHYGLKHYEFDLASIFKFSNCTLLEHSTQKIVEQSYEAQYSPESVITSYVPFRNGLMLSVCATLAQSLFPKEKCVIMLGNHASDFAYADCSEAFTRKMSEAVSEGTYGLVEFVSPLVQMTKTQVVETGLKLGTPYGLTWSCYEGKDKACGKCGSCIDRMKAFENNGTKDPIEYEGVGNE